MVLRCGEYGDDDIACLEGVRDKGDNMNLSKEGCSGAVLVNTDDLLEKIKSENLDC